MRKSLLQIFVSFVFLVTGHRALCQSNKEVMDRMASQLNAYTDRLPLASVYLKTSKDIYESVEDLWFSAYVLDAQYHTRFVMDKTLYVRLTRVDRDSTIWEEKYSIKNGIASGHIFLDKSLPEGDYLLSAYSAHSFHKNQPYFHAQKMVKVVKDIRSLLKEQHVDTTGNTNAPREIQFNIFPEGGKLVAGVSNTVAFKAVDKSGAPVDVSGALLKGDSTVKIFKSIHAGMGFFNFKPVSGVAYQLRLTDPKSGKLYPLPAIQSKGVVLHLLQEKRDTLVFSIHQSPGMINQPVFLRVQIRGRIQALAAGMLVDSLNIKIPTFDAAQGIAEVTLFDQNMRPMAERLVYLNPDKILNITANLSKDIYKTREKVSLKIRTSDKDGRPVSASIGVNVYDKVYQNSEDTKDILTHYYLSSQLKGKIHDPGYYFNTNNKHRKEALNVLLLTQGWRCYLWNDDELKDFRNRNQAITDSTEVRLIAINPKRTKPKAQVLMAFSTDESEKRTLLTDSLGRFALAPEDFVKGRWSYLKRFDTGKEDEYTVTVEDQFKAIRELNKNMRFDYPVAVAAKVEKHDKIPAERLSLGAINLNEVNVVAKKQNVFRDKYMGHLDSLAKFEGNTDFVSPNSSWLNVPVGYTGPKPVEGKIYTIWIGPNPPTRFPYNFGTGDFKKITYHYPKFTEEELLKKFKLTRIKGYYERREFYQPNYDKESDPLPDYRNTLLWLPEIITDKNGEASLEFFCSDINSSFKGIVEGVGADGLLGKKEFQFKVVK